MYSWTAVEPRIDRMSCGEIWPSESASPARTKSFSCTSMCFERLTRYVRSVSPSRDVTVTSWLPRLRPPKEITPSISVTTAGSDGWRASKSSITRGRPPVMSRVLALWRGSFARMRPGSIFSPASTWRRARTGIAYSLRPSGPSITMAGVTLRSRVSVMTFSRKPVCSSDSSRKVVPSTMSWKRTVPPCSATMTELYGSHDATRSPFSTVVPSFTTTSAP